MAMTGLDPIIQLENEEFGHYGMINGSYGMNIPKLTGCLDAFGFDMDINNADNIIKNDTECKPTYQKKVNRLRNLDVPGVFQYQGGGKIPGRYIIGFTNGNIQNPHVLRLEE